MSDDNPAEPAVDLDALERIYHQMLRDHHYIDMDAQRMRDAIEEIERLTRQRDTYRKRAKTRSNTVATLRARHERLREAAEPAISALDCWLSEGCDCSMEGGVHNCGVVTIRRVRSDLQAALRDEEKPCDD